jgi:hypothetical protein
LIITDLTDQSEVLANYEEILSAPVEFFLYTVSACRLHIPIIVERMIRAEKETFPRRSAANVKAIEKRRAKVLKKIENGISRGFGGK